MTKTDKADTHRASLLAAVPDASFTSYIGRSFKRVDYMTIFDRALAKHLNVLIKGPTGSGKTTALLKYAAERGKRFYSVSSSIGLEPSQLFGKYIPNEEDSGNHPIVWQDGPVTDLFRHGGVLLINEVNFVPERVGTVLFSALDKRRQIQLPDHHGEVITAHPDLLIVADMNPNYEGTRPLNKAFANRFAIQLEWDYDDKVESTLVPCGPLLVLAKQLRSKAADFDTPVSTNMLMEFDDMARDTAMGYDFATMVFTNHFADEQDRQAVSKVFEDMGDRVKAFYEALRQDVKAKDTVQKDPYHGWIVEDIEDVIGELQIEDDEEEGVPA